MHNHAPPGYLCPFCAVVAGVEADYCYTKQADIVLRAEHVTGFISSHGWPRNPGHVILVPNAHHEKHLRTSRRVWHVTLRGQPSHRPGHESGIRLRRCLYASTQRTGRQPGRLALSPARLSPLLGRRSLPSHDRAHIYPTSSAPPVCRETEERARPRRSWRIASDPYPTASPTRRGVSARPTNHLPEPRQLRRSPSARVRGLPALAARIGGEPGRLPGAARAQASWPMPGRALGAFIKATGDDLAFVPNVTYAHEHRRTRALPAGRGRRDSEHRSRVRSHRPRLALQVREERCPAWSDGPFRFRSSTGSRPPSRSGAGSIERTRVISRSATSPHRPH